MFGGYDGAHRVNDLHSFDFNTSTWRLMENRDAPSPRDRHVAVVCNNELYIFGGFGKFQFKLYLFILIIFFRWSIKS